MYSFLPKTTKLYKEKQATLNFSTHDKYLSCHASQAYNQEQGYPHTLHKESKDHVL